MISPLLPPPTRQDVRRGILYMVAAVFVFATVNALVKWEVQTYPVTEVVFFRCLCALIPCSLLIATHGGFASLRTAKLGEHFTRAIAQFGSMFCIFTAFSMMPLADAVAITFSNPLFLTVLSIPLLGEKVGRHRWAAVLVGFVGVLIMTQPGAGILNAGALFALANAAIGAFVTTAIRRMSLTEAPTTLVAYQIGFNALFSALLVPFGWVTPTLADAAIMSLIGLGSGVGQYWWTQAFRLAPSAVNAPFTYTAMVWAVLFGYLLWGDVPSTALVSGAAVVVGSGLYILYREALRRQGLVPAPLAAAGTASPVGGAPALRD
jgi:drug/metabolite transporter (DMT)-like permease